MRPRELDLERKLGAHDLPGIAESEPIVRELHLPTEPDRLLENAELVADAIADGRNLQGRQGVEIAGSEPPEAAASQAGLLLLFQQLFESNAELGHRLPGMFPDAEVDERVAEVRPWQELGRHVADGAHLARVIGGTGIDPALEQPIADRVGERHVLVVLGRDRGKSGLQAEEIAEEIASDRIRAATGARVLVAGSGLDHAWTLGGGGRRLARGDRVRLPIEFSADLARDIGTRHELRIEGSKPPQGLGDDHIAQQHQQDGCLGFAHPRPRQADLQDCPVRREQLGRDKEGVDR